MNRPINIYVYGINDTAMVLYENYYY